MGYFCQSIFCKKATLILLRMLLVVIIVKEAIIYIHAKINREWVGQMYSEITLTFPMVYSLLGPEYPSF